MTPGHSKPARLTSLFVFTLLVSGTAAAQGNWVCSGSVVAWDEKVGKAKREALKIEAEARAFQDLASQASFRSAITSTDMSARWWQDTQGGTSTFNERFLSLTTSRSAVRISELLHGGEYRWDGNKKSMRVQYCLPKTRFDQARGEIEAEWDGIADQLRGRFEDLEQAIDNGELSYASQLFPALKSDVSDLVMDREEYTSPISGKTNTFAGWIELWSEEVRSERAYAAYCVGQAQTMVDDGRLAKAQRYVDEALHTDRRHVPALQLERTIEEKWEARSSALEVAVDAAAVGKATKARKQLTIAHHIDREEATAFTEAQTQVEAQLASFNEANPRWMIGFSLGYGSVGVEPSETLERYTAPDYPDIDANRPIGIGIEGRVRLGRHLQTWVSGGLRNANATSRYTTGSFMSMQDAAVGIGYRTVRREKHNTSFQVGGGVVRQDVTIEADIPGLSDDSDSRTAAFARIAVEGRHTALWVEHGIGFEDDEELSPVVWSDSWIVGLTYSFH